MIEISDNTKQRKWWKDLIYLTLFAVFAYLIILLKVVGYSGLNFIYFYTIFITTFMFTRIMGSFFYKTYKDKLSPARKKALGNYFPTVSFVIPCKNEEKVIYRTISSCFNTDYPKDKVEIIAINDGSTDGTLKEMLRAKKNFPDCRIVVINFPVNKGKRQAMAEGFMHTTGEILIQVDSDSYPEKNAIKEIVNPFIDRKVGATVGHTDPSNIDTNWLTKMQAAYYFMSFRTLKATESIFDMVFCCSGCFSAYRREYIMPIVKPWLNETFMGKEIIFGDDRALTNWIIRLGYKTVYVYEAKAYTVVPEKLKQFLKQQVRWKKGWMINSFRIAPEVFRKDKFVALTYFIPLIFLTLLTPFIAIKALFINPIFYGTSPALYILGIFLISLMLYSQYNVYQGGKYGKYMLVWSVLNMTILSYILVYAIYDLKNMAWGTR